MNTKVQLWKIYAFIGQLIANNSRTGNIVGDFAEELMADFYNGTLAPPSTKGFDFVVNNIKYQVKSRMANSKNKFAGNLSDLHSFKFDYLLVVLYNKDGSVNMVKEFTVRDAQKMANSSGNRYLIPVSSVRNNTSCVDKTNLVKSKYSL